MPLKTWSRLRCLKEADQVSDTSVKFATASHRRHIKGTKRRKRFPPAAIFSSVSKLLATPRHRFLFDAKNNQPVNLGAAGRCKFNLQPIRAHVRIRR